MNPPDAEITELPSSPGARLKREREASGMTEQQAAEALNLDPAVIALLEANLGIAIVPASAPQSPNIRRIPLRDTGLRRTVSIYAVAGRRRSHRLGDERRRAVVCCCGQ